MSVPDPEVQCPSDETLKPQFRLRLSSRDIASTQIVRGPVQPVPAVRLAHFVVPPRVFADLPARKILVIILARPESSRPER
jgi:hypothetical protein